MSRSFLSVNLCSLGNHIVNEYNLTATSIIGCRKKHTVTCNACNAGRLKVCDNDDLLTHKLLGLVVVLDAGNDHSLFNAIIKS